MSRLVVSHGRELRPNQSLKLTGIAVDDLAARRFAAAA
jgi:hypothetical protein